jgi:hypothetical protein
VTGAREARQHLSERAAVAKGRGVGGLDNNCSGVADWWQGPRSTSRKARSKRP